MSPWLWMILNSAVGSYCRSGINYVPPPMKTRTHFAHRIDMLDAAGEVQEHLAGVEDYILAEAVWREAIARWPDATILLRQGARVVHDSRRPRVVK
jgi:hypothetical protein